MMALAYRYMYRKVLTIVILSLLSFSAIAQGTVRGIVIDDATGEPIPFANVVLRSADSSHAPLGSATDLSGLFVFNRLTAGDYTLTIRYIGYNEHQQAITITRGQTIKLSLRLTTAATVLHDVVITDSRIEQRKMQTQVSVEKITATQIQQMPSIGGVADIAQYMQVLPGVSSTGDQGGQLHIRGGSMIQNLCLLDGMVVYNPFHSIGLYSIFETDAILSADIYTGGFGAQYGGRLSSVMDITTRDGNKRRHSGKIGINTFGANLMLEGPLKRETTTSPTSITYLLSAKNSYLSKTSETLYPTINGSLPFDYLDLYGKLTVSTTGGSKLSLYGFRFDDSVANYHDVANYHWKNYGIGSHFQIITGSSSVLEGALAYSDYKIKLNDASGLDKYSNINGFNMSLNITNFFRDNRLVYGISMEGYTTDYLYYNAYNISTEQKEHTNDIAFFGTYTWKNAHWIVEPGLRYVYYNALSEGSLEPRLSAKYLINDKLRLKMAGGLYSQIFLDARSDNDIVNLFNGFLTSVHLSKPATFNGEEASSCIQKAQHIVMGAEYDITSHFTANIEGYIKNFSQLFNANRNKLFDRYDAAYQAGGAYAKATHQLTDYIVEQGIAYGIDLSLCLDIERLYLWATYSIAHVTRTDEVQTYTPHYDRRHTVNLLATYAIGAHREWEVSARWSFGSGFPYTQTQGVYEQWQPSAINDNYANASGTYGIYYADIYQGRLPAYHRLDISAKRKISIGARSMLELSAGITNVYNRNNLFYFDRLTLSRVDQLPILATIGATFRF